MAKSLHLYSQGAVYPITCVQPNNSVVYNYPRNPKEKQIEDAELLTRNRARDILGCVVQRTADRDHNAIVRRALASYCISGRLPYIYIFLLLIPFAMRSGRIIT